MFGEKAILTPPPRPPLSSTLVKSQLRLSLWICSVLVISWSVPPAIPHCHDYQSCVVDLAVRQSNFFSLNFIIFLDTQEPESSQLNFKISLPVSVKRELAQSLIGIALNPQMNMGRIDTFRTLKLLHSWIGIVKNYNFFNFFILQFFGIQVLDKTDNTSVFYFLGSDCR